MLCRTGFPCPPTSRSLRSAPAAAEVAFQTLAQAEGMDNGAVVALPFVAGCWPRACCLGVCLRAALTDQRESQHWGGRAEIGHCAACCPGGSSWKHLRLSLLSPHGSPREDTALLVCHTVGNWHGASRLSPRAVPCWSCFTASSSKAR